MNANQPKTVFVTGANGFIGTNLVRLLLRNNYEVHILARKNSNLWRLKDVLTDIRIHIGDISDQKLLKRVVNKIDPQYIFHLASYGNSSKDTNLSEMIGVNILGLKNLLEATFDINYKAFVITGSSSEYGFKNKPMWETDNLEPNSYYSATKASATLIAQSFALLNDKPIFIARPFSVYGPYEEKNRLIPTVIRLALANKEIPLTPGKVQRDFIYVEDVTKALLKMAKTKLKNGEIINLGTAEQHGNNDIIKIIEKILHKKLKVKIGNFPKRAWDTNYWVASNKKAKKLLSWQPKYSLEKGLRKTIDWIKANDN
jgi:nucleoside-diphosphate-sugar epimerase